MSISELRGRKTISTATYCLLFGVVLLAIVQLLFNRSLWLDEAMLAVNIIDRDFGELFSPLDYYQVAPVLFLIIEKLLSIIVPGSEMGLRLFPFVAFLISLFCFIRILRLLHFSESSLWLGILLFACNPTMLYYSSEVKQYMCDVLVITVFYYFLLRSWLDEDQRWYALAIAGVLAIAISNVAPVILLTAGVFLSFQRKNGYGMVLSRVVSLGALWLIFFSCYYLFFIVDHPSRDMMLAYWSTHDAFSPINPFQISFYKFYFDKWKMMTTVLFQFGTMWMIIITVFSLIGLITLSRRKNVPVLILIAAPVFIHLVLSGLYLYPFETRLILYMCPLVVVLCLFGLEALTNFFVIGPNSVRVIFLSSLLAVTLGVGAYFKGFYGSTFPFENEEVKRAINYIMRSRIVTDELHVFGVSHYFVRYYQYAGIVSINDKNLHDHHNDSDSELQTIVNEGGTTWLLFSHTDDGKKVVERLMKIGFVPTDTYLVPGAAAYHYNFTQPAAGDTRQSPK